MIRWSIDVRSLKDKRPWGGNLGAFYVQVGVPVRCSGMSKPALDDWSLVSFSETQCENCTVGGLGDEIKRLCRRVFDNALPTELIIHSTVWIGATEHSQTMQPTRDGRKILRAGYRNIITFEIASYLRHAGLSVP